MILNNLYKIVAVRKLNLFGNEFHASGILIDVHETLAHSDVLETKRLQMWDDFISLSPLVGEHRVGRQPNVDGLLVHLPATSISFNYNEIALVIFSKSGKIINYILLRSFTIGHRYDYQKL